MLVICIILRPFLDLVFIDEISMVGADKLQRVHESLSNMANKKKGMPFGGASVICFGDLKQVKKKYFRGELGYEH